MINNISYSDSDAERDVEARLARLRAEDRAYDFVEAKRQAARAHMAEQVALWDLQPFPSHQSTREYDGRSALDDVDSSIPHEMAAVELDRTPGANWADCPWWQLTRALNLSEFLHTISKVWVHRVWFEHPVLGGAWVASESFDERPDPIDGANLVQVWSVDAHTPSEMRFVKYPAAKAALDRRNRQAHLESRNVVGSEHLMSNRALADAGKERPFFHRLPVEFPHVFSNHDRDGGDIGIAAVINPASGLCYAVKWEKRFLNPTSPAHQLSWQRAKFRRGKGPQLRAGSWLKKPVSVIGCGGPDEAVDVAWQWAAEIDLHNDTPGGEGHLDLDSVLSREASEEDLALV